MIIIIVQCWSVFFCTQFILITILDLITLYHRSFFFFASFRLAKLMRLVKWFNTKQEKNYVPTNLKSWNKWKKRGREKESKKLAQLSTIKPVQPMTKYVMKCCCRLYLWLKVLKIGKKKILYSLQQNVKIGRKNRSNHHCCCPNSNKQLIISFSAYYCCCHHYYYHSFNDI